MCNNYGDPGGDAGVARALCTVPFPAPASLVVSKHGAAHADGAREAMGTHMSRIDAAV